MTEVTKDGKTQRGGINRGATRLSPLDRNLIGNNDLLIEKEYKDVVYIQDNEMALA